MGLPWYPAKRMDLHQFEAVGLYDPRSPKAAERRELIEWLVGRGVTIDQMVHATRVATLTGLAGDLTLRPGSRHTLEEIAARIGLPIRELEEIRRAIGLAPVARDEPVLSEDDAAGFTSFAAGGQMFGPAAAGRFARVMGSSLARIAEAAVSLFLVNVEGPMKAQQATELELAKANVQAIESLNHLLTVVQGLFRVHLETAIRRLRIARRGGAIDTAHLTVGFVDLVGFTTLSRRMSTRELADVVDRFEDTAHEVVTARDGRIVKLVGDEVMFVTLDAAAACDVGLTLIERFAGDVDVTPRGGLATGELLIRGGDYYGPVVNLAARLSDVAVPSELLVTRELAAEAAMSGLRFDPAGKRLLKGFDEPVSILAVERQADER